MWTDPATPAGPQFYTMGCEFKGAPPAPERASLYQARHGELDGATEFYLLEYPEPPVVDFSKMFPGKNTTEAEVPVPAPYFSAMLCNRETGAVSYYVLGQSPVGGGTTLRSVAHGGVNSNLGPGPGAAGGCVPRFIAGEGEPGGVIRNRRNSCRLWARCSAFPRCFGRQRSDGLLFVYETVKMQSPLWELKRRD